MSMGRKELRQKRHITCTNPTTKQVLGDGNIKREDEHFSFPSKKEPDEESINYSGVKSKEIKNFKIEAVKRERKHGTLKIQKLIKQEPADSDDEIIPNELTEEDIKPFTGELTALQIQAQGSELKVIRRIAKFTCEVCLKGVGTKGGLKYHIRTHLFGRPYKCNICKKSYATKNDFETHNKRHAGKTFQCNFCNKNYTTKQYLTSHIMLKHLPKTIQCEFCRHENLFSNTQSLNRHMHMSHPQDAFKKPIVNYVCSLCGHSTKYRQAWLGHMEQAKKMLHKCKKCQQKFSCRKLLSEHSKQERNSYQICDICKVPKKNIFAHKAQMHGNYKCKFCSFTEENRQRYYNHTKTCGTEQQAKELGIHCKECNLYFRTRQLLATHNVESHWKYQCYKCPRTYIDKVKWQKHEKNHQLKIFSCLSCPKRPNFDKKRFEIHFRIHHNGMRQQTKKTMCCDFCNTKYLNKIELKQHVLTSHKKELRRY